ncbi:YadA C-terminal domain-containing protein [Escherichia coli]|uniref:YadA C-terminal domain-containing protein n=4 Tax=Escherichia coli TaxID=562 RepID=UPI0020231371|nr:YadA C-terminal domain-containing protein [Escherichia coli]
MSKKFTKTVLSTAVAGVFWGATFGVIAGEGGVTEIRGDREALSATNTVINGVETIKLNDEYELRLYNNGNSAAIYKKNDEGKYNQVLGSINTQIGSIMIFNQKELNDGAKKILEQYKNEINTQEGMSKYQDALSKFGNSIAYPVDSELLKKENIRNLSSKDIGEITEKKNKVSNVINSTTKEDYITAVRSGGSLDVILELAKNGNMSQLAAYSDTFKKLNNLTEKTKLEISFALDRDGNITLDEKEAVTNDRESVKNVVAAIQADTTIYQKEDGSYTHDVTASKNVRVSDAIVDLDKSIKDRTTVGVNSDGRFTSAEGATKTIAVNDGLVKLASKTDRLDAAIGATDAKVEARTTVGVNSDGTLTRAEGAKKTISVNDGLVALSGRTDRIDAAVGGIDGRVTANTQAVQKNSRAIASNTRTLQQHSARLDSQQRQINENHKEMKRAAAQSAALTGLFQPYSVGKFNASAAVGGYSDEQALAVGVGYRFNEQTAAKAGVAFSDGDASWNVGVNFEF